MLERFHAELPLVGDIARHLLSLVGEVIPLDDLQAAGREGLIAAARRYDPKRTVPFRGYASIRVRGAMIDAMRTSAVLPRRAWDKVRAEQAAQLIDEGNLEAIYAPDADAATTDDRPLDEHLSSMVTAAAVRFASDGEHSAGPSVDPRANPEQALAKAELLALVERALDSLDEREAQVIRLHWLEEQPMSAIAKILELDKSWVVRIHTRAMACITKRVRKSV